MYSIPLSISLNVPEYFRKGMEINFVSLCTEVKSSRIITGKTNENELDEHEI
jgi:hypothetical protein